MSVSTHKIIYIHTYTLCILSHTRKVLVPINMAMLRQHEKGYRVWFDWSKINSDNIICQNAMMHHSVSQFQAPPTIIMLESFYMFRLIKVKLKNVFMVINLFFEPMFYYSFYCSFLEFKTVVLYLAIDLYEWTPLR